VKGKKGKGETGFAWQPTGTVVPESPQAIPGTPDLGDRHGMPALLVAVAT